MTARSGQVAFSPTLGIESPPPEAPIPTHHRLFVGDARDIDPAKIGPVHLVVTSPPYWTVKDYGAPSQIGFGQNLKEYVNSLRRVWRNCYRALVPGGRMAVNVGDQYLRGIKGRPYQIVPVHSLVVNDLMCDNQAKFDFLGSIVWRKVSTTNTSGGASVMGSYPFPRSVYPCFENEFIALFRKPGEAPRPLESTKELSRLSLEDWRDLTQGVWTIPGARAKHHPAAFPESIPSRLIRMFSFPGETILDPFVGQGTTMRAAASLGRHSVGVELGFTTVTGAQFTDVVRAEVAGAERITYAGNPSFRIERVDSLPVSPQPSHSYRGGRSRSARLKRLPQ
jgi:modification methylase